MKIPTKNYSDYKVGDLLIYDEGGKRQDIGYIESILEDAYKVIWFREAGSSQENAHSFISWNNGFVFPVTKT